MAASVSRSSEHLTYEACVWRSAATPGWVARAWGLSCAVEVPGEAGGRCGKTACRDLGRGVGSLASLPRRWTQWGNASMPHATGPSPWRGTTPSWLVALLVAWFAGLPLSWAASALYRE